MNKFDAQKRLALLWFINAGIIGVFFVLLTVSGKFGDRSKEGWEWFSQNIIPTLTLMIGTFSASMGQAVSTVKIDKFYFSLAYWISIFYLLILYLIIGISPFAFNLNQTSFIDLLNSSKIYLNIFQGVVTFSLGLFFVKKAESK